MPARKGTSGFRKFYIGTTQVSKVYKGTTQIYPSYTYSFGSYSGWSDVASCSQSSFSCSAAT
jgi:hypothetical protein